MGMDTHYPSFSRTDNVGSFPNGIELNNKFDEMGHDK